MKHQQNTQQGQPPTLHSALTAIDFYLFFFILVIATLTRIIKSQEKIRPRVILGELMLALVMSIFFYLFGLYEGLSSIQMVLIAIPAALGNVRLFNYILTFLQSKQIEKRF